MTEPAHSIDHAMSPLENLDFLENAEKYFQSPAEMLVTRAREIPDRPHLLYYDQTITYAQTNERANRVANFLKDRGVKKGDVVSAMVLNSPETYYAMFGAQKIGAIAGSVNYMLKGPELAYVLDDSRPKVVFVSSEFMADFARGVEQAAHRPAVVEVVTGAAHNVDIGQLFLSDILDQYPLDEALVHQNGADPFMLLYSSGTTGRPKGILLSNAGQLGVCRAIARSGMVTGDDVMMIILPLFHTNPLCVWSYPMTYCGQTICIRKGFSPADFWPAITENRVTIVMGVPAMYNYVFYSVDPETVDRKNLRLKWAFSGAAPLSVELIHGFEKKFDTTIVEGYGLTEVTGLSTFNPPLGTKKPGSVGPAIPEQQIRIVDESHRELPAGKTGEICTKGVMNMIGYLNRPEATKEAIVDGWLHTGDVGYMDADGYCTIVDRKKDLINRGGENIYPREIEMVIEAHPEVLTVAVIGVPDQALGERVKAYIEPARPGQLSPEAVKTYLEDKIAGYKIPEFIEITDTIPRNPTGKILKQELRKIAQNTPGG